MAIMLSRAAPQALPKSAAAVPRQSTGAATPTFDSVFTFQKLWQAFLETRKGKRRSLRVHDFEQSAAARVAGIFRELHAGTYKPTPCRTFSIFCTCGQKTRIITAPAFRDLIVQRAVYEALYPLFARCFIRDTYGCVRGGGTLRAADRAQHFLRTAPPGSYVLKLDIRKYYYSIPHGTLRSALARKIHDKRLLDLCIAFTAPGDRGLCVGSTLAQLFGLVYLSRLDEYCKRVLKLKRYVRYVDDILIIGETKERCRALKEHLEQWLHETLDLELSHWSISPVRRGVNFCGYKATARTRVIRPRSLKTFKRALKRRFLARR